MLSTPISGLSKEDAGRKNESQSTPSLTPIEWTDKNKFELYIYHQNGLPKKLEVQELRQEVVLQGSTPTM